jgi:hypothetical protein
MPNLVLINKQWNIIDSQNEKSTFCCSVEVHTITNGTSENGGIKKRRYITCCQLLKTQTEGMQDHDWEKRSKEEGDHQIVSSEFVNLLSFSLELITKAKWNSGTSYNIWRQTHNNLNIWRSISSELQQCAILLSQYKQNSVQKQFRTKTYCHIISCCRWESIRHGMG